MIAGLCSDFLGAIEDFVVDGSRRLAKDTCHDNSQAENRIIPGYGTSECTGTNLRKSLRASSKHFIPFGNVFRAGLFAYSKPHSLKGFDPSDGWQRY
jgi:hypothetical protein